MSCYFVWHYLSQTGPFFFFFFKSPSLDFQYLKTPFRKRLSMIREHYYDLITLSFQPHILKICSSSLLAHNLANDRLSLPFLFFIYSYSLFTTHIKHLISWFKKKNPLIKASLKVTHNFLHMWDMPSVSIVPAPLGLHLILHVISSHFTEGCQCDICGL